LVIEKLITLFADALHAIVLQLRTLQAGWRGYMAHSSGLKETLGALFSVEKGERLKTALLGSWLFLFICCYYVLRPVRRGMILEGLGNEAMPLVYIGTAAITALVVWAYSKFAHLPRKKLIGTIYGIFALNLVGWWQAFQFESKITAGLFWIWLDVFSIMGVTLFWMYANDLFNSSSAKRLFGVISAGGGLGAVLGSSITAALVKPLGTVNMLLVAAGIVGLTMAIFMTLESVAQKSPVKRDGVLKASRDVDMSKISNIVSLIFSNKFLLFLTLLVCFERMTPDLVQYLYHEVLATLATGRDAIAALDANLERWRAIAEVGIELFLVSYVVRKFGTTFCLTSSGAMIAACLGLFAILGNPLIILGVFHADEAIRHAWFKAAKELTYTVTDRDILYYVKPVIEMFFYRFSRGLAGVVIFVVNSVLGLGVPGLLATGAIIAGGWAFFGWKLSREYFRLELEAMSGKAATAQAPALR
jgi:ATP:ADP antiporter, AAA family